MGGIHIYARQSAAALSIAVHAVIVMLLFTLGRQSFPTEALVRQPPLRVELEPLTLIEPAKPPPKAKLSAPPDELRNIPDPVVSPVAIPAADAVAPEPVATPAQSANRSGPLAIGPSIGSMVGNGGAGSEGGDSATGGHDGAEEAGPTLARPDWIMKPTGEEMLEALPEGLKEQRISGGAILSCLVTPQNRARDCKVLGETKGTYAFGRSYEFGRSALRLARHFRLRPPVRDGQPRYDIRVRVSIYWKAL